MERNDLYFLLPVTDLGDVPVRASGIATIATASGTSTVIYYADGMVLTLTHADQLTADTVRDELMAGVKSALQQVWNQVDEVTVTPSFAVSAVAASHVVVPVS